MITSLHAPLLDKATTTFTMTESLLDRRSLQSDPVNMESSLQSQLQQGLRSRPHDDDCHDCCHRNDKPRFQQQQQQHVGDAIVQVFNNNDSSSGYQSPAKEAATPHDNETALSVDAAASKNHFNKEKDAIGTMIPSFSEHASPHRAANLASVTVTLQDDQAQEPHHQQSAQKRRKRRAPSQAATTVKGDPVETPGANDILCGRGKHIAEHVGCLRFRALIREKRSEYNVHRCKYEKGALARQVLEQVASMDPPGRFLSQGSDGLWRDVSATKALEKVSQALREKKWDHPIGADSKFETEAVDGNDAEQNVYGSDKCITSRRRERLQLAPNHPNSHISQSDMRRRVRAGARVSVYDPTTDTFNMGIIRKRLSTRLQVEMFHAASGAPKVIDVDLNRDKIRIDSRKLVMNSRTRIEDHVTNDKRTADGGNDGDDDQPLPLNHALEEMVGGTGCEYAYNAAQIQNR